MTSPPQAPGATPHRRPRPSRQRQPAAQPRDLRLEVLPADEGDCLLLSCRGGGAEHHVLVDGGTPATAERLRARLEALPGRRLELLVVTHIDADHIGGIVRLLREPGFELALGDVWFNGFRHLPRNAVARPRGVRDAENLTDVLTGKTAAQELPWNLAFDGGAAMRAGGEDEAVSEALPTLTLPWGLRLTLLSPTPRRLDALYKDWAKYLKGLHAEAREPALPPAPRPRGRLDLEALAAARTKEDAAAPNGSSIALLAEFGTHTCLLGADAFPGVLLPALRSLAARRPDLMRPTPDGPRLALDVFKLPHHGSRANVTGELFELVRARHYVVSTSGNRFNHPDDEAMARVITRGGPGHTLWFNYHSDRTQPWDDPEWQAKYGYTVNYPEGEGGVTLALTG